MDPANPPTPSTCPAPGSSGSSGADDGARAAAEVLASTSGAPVVVFFHGRVWHGPPGSLRDGGRRAGFEVRRVVRAGAAWELRSRLTLLDPSGVAPPLWEEWAVPLADAVVDDHEAEQGGAGAAVTWTRRRGATTDVLHEVAPGAAAPGSVQWTRVAETAPLGAGEPPELARGSIAVAQARGAILRGGYAEVPAWIRAVVDAQRPEHAFAPTAADPLAVPASPRVLGRLLRSRR